MSSRLDLKSDYHYDFFKPIYSDKQHYAADYYCKKQEDGKFHFLVELELFKYGAKENLVSTKEHLLIIIEENGNGKLEIISETNISEDLRKQITDLIREHSKCYRNK